MQIKQLLMGMFCFSASSALAQEDKDSTKNPLSFGGYVESYYSYDFNKPATHQKSGLVYSHNRSKEVAVLSFFPWKTF